MLRKLFTHIRPFHFVLLIPFFLLHIENNYFGLLPVPVVTKSIISFSALCLSLFLVAKVFLKENNKIGVFCFVALGYFFGFGAVKDFLETFPSLYKFTSYRYLLPLIIIMLALLFIYLRKSTRDLTRLNTFLFLAVSLNLLLEVFLFSKNSFTKADLKNDLGDPNLTEVKNFTPCTNCEQPDIFYIVFDEYTSSDCLKKYWNYSNDTLDNYLLSNNFFISKKSRSNYCFTTFSVSSIMEMQYLNLPPDYTQAVAKDFARGEYTLMRNSAIKILEKQGYNIHNHSIFDFENHPTELGTYFYQLRGMYVDDETLFGRVKRDIGWNFASLFSRDPRKAVEQLVKEKTDHNVEGKKYSFALAKDAIKNEDPAKKDFFFFHFLLPHDPFVFDAKGNIKYYSDYRSSLQEKYLEQLKYTNTLLVDMVDYINKHYNKKAVIVVQGDHGFKEWPGEEHFEDIAFQNLNATYLPDTTYTGYYDGVSSVNTFRLLFNHYFNSNFNILPDKTVQIYIKPELKKNYGIREKNN
ncbi:MAG: sulfatase-like hydrolase/transferase [Sphingobacteriales bacterium]|nr:sulfatase-like hydrolase/transferase [Sphingobacteriales bacterium]